jgi:PAS domain S-box-containing protein
MLARIESQAERPLLDVWLPYIFGLSAVLAGTMMGLMGLPVFGRVPPYVIYILPVMAAAAYGGSGPGLLATMTSTLAIVFIFRPSDAFQPIFGPTMFLFLFVLDGLAISWLGEQMRISMRTAANSQQQVQAVRERQEKILNSISDAFGALDAGGKFTYANQHLATVASQEQSKLLGKPVWDILPDLSQGVPRKTLLRAFQEQVPVHFDMFVTGLKRWFAMSAYPLDPGLSLLGRDVTEQKEAERILRESEERLKFAPEAVMIGTWTHDLPEGRVLWSSELEKIFGLFPGTFAGTEQAFFDLIHPEDQEPVRKVFARATQEQSIFEVEFRYRHASGETRWMLGRGSGYFDESGRPFRLAGIGIDITAQKRNEEKLRHTQRLESLGILAGGIAHDFNNLLVGIMGNASLVCDSLPRGHSDRALLEEVVLAGERAAHLTRQMLAYSGKGKFLIGRLQLSDVVAGIKQLVRSSIPKNVDVRMDLDGDLPLVEGDEGQLQQVIMNLVINAAEAVPKERTGTVWVRTRQRRISESLTSEVLGADIAPGSYVSVEVEDNGIGMDSSTRGRIFEPFFTTKFVGRGLGLAAVLGIIRGHKGALNVTSTPGKGSKFEVLLPATEERKPPEPHDHRAPQDLRGEEIILIVDDEISVRNLACSVLEGYGYTVLQAQDGYTAVELVRLSPIKPALVLLDLSMPGISAQQAIEQLKAIRPELYILLSSGYDESEVLRQFSERPAVGFMQKPYTPTQLAERVKLALARTTADSGAASSRANVLSVGAAQSALYRNCQVGLQ